MSLQNPAILRLPQTSANAGQTVRVPVMLDARGDEIALAFSVHFSPYMLANPRAELGSDTAAIGSTLTVNDNLALNGKIGVLMDASPTGPSLAAKVCHVADIIFDVLPSASGVSGLEFGSDPVPLGGSDRMANNIVLRFQNGDLVVGDGPSPPPRPISDVGYQGAWVGNPATGNTATPEPSVPIVMLPDGTITHGNLPATGGGIVGPDGTIFGFSPLMLAVIAAVGIYIYSES